MFYMSSTRPCEIQGTIKVRHRITGLGNIKDIDGVMWNIHSIYSDYVCAKKVENLHPYYGSTATYNSPGLVSETWKPYLIEVVES